LIFDFGRDAQNKILPKGYNKIKDNLKEIDGPSKMRKKEKRDSD